MYTNTQTLITFILYLMVILSIGWFGYKATQNLADYILGGRRLGKVVTALSAGASDMSGWLLMGFPGAVYLFGISYSWLAIGLIMGAWLNWRFVAARLRLYTEKCGNALTLPDYFVSRFEAKTNTLRMITALAILTFFTIYCAAGIVASALLFKNLFGLSYAAALWIGAFATIFYVFIGGFLAVSWTDTVQASLIIAALIVAPLMVVHAIGGITPSMKAVETVATTHLDIFHGLNSIGVISLLGWSLGYFGQPHILVRFMAAESPKTIPAARRIGMSWMIFCLAGALAVGFLGQIYFSANPAKAGLVAADAEMVFIEVARQLFNPWICGFLLAAILAAVMSTLACQLLVCSSALTEDIYKTFIRKTASQRELVWCGRAMVLFVALIAIALAGDPNNQILKIVSYAWAGFGAAFGPVILLSLTWPRMTEKGALAGIIVGGLTVVIWKQYAWLQLYEIIPGFIFASFAVVVMSLLSRPPVAIVRELFGRASVEEEIDMRLVMEAEVNMPSSTREVYE